MSRPLVSCICPTYNRRAFLPNLLYMFDYQTYPADRRELVILDDSPSSNQDVIDEFVAKHPSCVVRYVYRPERMQLGQKRNELNRLAKGEYLVCMDDDDYYPPDKVAHAVTRMQGAKAVVCGSTQIYVYFTQTQEIYRFGPYGPGHATNGTLSYHRSYLKGRTYEEQATFAEEKHFMGGFSSPILQLDPMKTILCINHGANTVDKMKIRENSGTLTTMKLKSFIKDKRLLEFYKNLS